MWKRQWVNAADFFEDEFGEAFRVIQNRGRGLVITGTREWTDYSVQASITPHLVKAFGLAARVQGLERYYALLLSNQNTIKLIKRLDGEIVLAEQAFAWEFGQPYHLELPTSFVEAQLEAVFDDIGVDAAKTGMLFSREVIETVADFLSEHRVPLVVDPVMVASSGAKLLEYDAVDTLVSKIFPLATVVTPNLPEAEALVGASGTRHEIARRIYDLGAPAVIVTGGHGEDAVDHLFDGQRHIAIEVERHDVAATHGAGCTHSATLAALLARGESLEAAAQGAARVASEAVRNGLVEIGGGEGPVNVLA